MAAVAVAAAAAGVHQHRVNQRAIQARLDALAAETADGLRARLAIYEYGMRGARGAVIGAGVDSVSAAQFRRYLSSRELAREFPGARGFGLVRRVRDAGAFAAQMRRSGTPDFRVRELAPHRGEHWVITFVEPRASNLGAIGLDLASEPQRRAAAQRALETGQATLTGPITLVQAAEKRYRGALLLLPVYRGDAPPDTPAAREAATAGWIYAPLVIDEVIAAAGFGTERDRLTITDVTDAAAPRAFFETPWPDARTVGTSATELDLYGRRWRIEVTATPTLVATLETRPPWRAALVAGLVALLLSAMLGAWLQASSSRGRLRAHRARTAAIVDSAHDAILGLSMDGRVVDWNAGATRMFGYREAEALGRSLVELIVPQERVGEDAALMRRVMGGEQVAGFETVRRHQDGSVVHVELSASTIREGRKVVGMAATLRDIGARKDSEARVLQLNATLEDQVAERTAELQSYYALQRAILASAGYAIIATDPDGVITIFNPAAEAMLGYAAAEMVGRETPQRFHDPAEMRLRANVLTLELDRLIDPGFEVFVAKVRDGGSDANEWTYVARDGSRVPVLVTFTALRARDGEPIGFLGIAVDLRERKRREAALAVSERKLRSLFELSPIGIVLHGEGGDFVEFNEAFRMLTGYSADELRALDYRLLTPPEYEAQDHAQLDELKRNGRYGPYEKHFVRKDGSRLAVRLNGVALKLDGRPHIWSLVEDITLQREAEQAMRSAVVAAEEVSRAKTDFLANMSHEIRTPMNAVIGMLQLLHRTELDPRQRDYAGKADSAARTLLGILNDILDFSKIEAGRQVLDEHEFDLQQLLGEISVLLSANVGDKDIEVVFDVDPRLPARLVGDALRLQQVLINLTGNAIKFTHLGEVVLAVRMREDAHDAARIGLDFEVRDTGIGISPEQLESIFEGFSQAEASTTRRFGGTGLGLAISQRLVQLMGGQLQVESQRGLGSRFFFSIALGRAAAAADGSERSVGLRTLVVDDNAIARDSIVATVRSLGWQADAAPSGADALRRMRQAAARGEHYQAVFLDWRMPGMDGWETMQRIRADHIDDAAPLIVMVTAQGREMLEERSASDRDVLDGFLVKPVTAGMLAAAVAQARGAREAATSAAAITATAVAATAQEAPAAAAPSPPSQGAAAARRLEGLRVLVVEDNPTNQQVARELLQAEGARVTVVDGGRPAVDLLAGEFHRFDAVLMDIQMPGMDGYTATREIRGRLGVTRLPVIAMTANVQPSDREAALAAGMNDHIGKPFELDALVALLRRWTGRDGDVAVRSLERAPRVTLVAEAAPATAAEADTVITVKTQAVVPPPAAAAAAPKPPAPMTSAASDGTAIFDGAAALARFGGNAGAFRNALDGFAGDGRACIEAYGQALARGDAETAGRELHTLKGIAATVGAVRLATIAAGFEREDHGASGPTSGLAAIRRLTELRRAFGEAEAAMAPARQASQPASVAATAAPPPLDARRLAELDALLASSNLRALALFRELEGGIMRGHADAAQQVAAAVARLDFAAARSALAPLLSAQEG